MKALNYIKITGSLFLLAVVIASCTVGKKYQRPELNLPESFTSENIADSNSVADLGWREFFTDTSLQRLIESGLQYNQDLLVAVKRMDIAQRQLLQARKLNLPEAELNIVGSISRPSDNSLNGVSLGAFLGQRYLENYNAAINFSWEADIWGKLRGQKEKALAAYLQTGEAARAVQTRLIAEIAQGYFNLLMLDRQLEITKRNLILNDSFYVATRMLMEAGMSNALAVQQAAAQKQNTALLIPEIEMSIAMQENTLQLLTGQWPGAVSRVAASDFRFATALNTGLPVGIVARRPDVRAAEFALQIANAEVGVAQANMYPALNITAGGGLESFKASNWFNIPGSLFGLATGGIAQPLFKRRALKTRFEVSKLEREQAVIQFRQSVLQATTEVHNALVQVEKLNEQETIAADQVSTLRNAVSDAQQLFRSDMAIYLEVITAQANALQAELNQASIHRRQLAAVVELYRALGGGAK
ncbi:MAG: efflux transporter outer membrane subunit [Chitinophagaceae bacterium]|nr:efflux transporter outer membrane subunit [Chitinophagaceae bacterium]